MAKRQAQQDLLHNETKCARTIRCPSVRTDERSLLTEAVVDACRRSIWGETVEELSDRPLVINSINEDAIIVKLAYWPDSVNVGLRVMDLLRHGDEQGSLTVHDGLYGLAHGKESRNNKEQRSLCELASVETVAALGVLKVIRVPQDSVAQYGPLAEYEIDRCVLASHLYNEDVHGYQ